MAFIAKGTLDPHGAPVLRLDIITNSVVMVVGDAVKLVSGFVSLATGGDVGVYGICESIETNKGVGLNTDGTTGAAMGSFINAYTVASTNQTVGLVRCVSDISNTTLYTVPLATAPGGTTGDNLIGYFMDLNDEKSLANSSATTGTAQFFNWGLDPALSTTNVIASIHESLVFQVAY